MPMDDEAAYQELETPNFIFAHLSLRKVQAVKLAHYSLGRMLCTPCRWFFYPLDMIFYQADFPLILGSDRAANT